MRLGSDDNHLAIYTQLRNFPIPRIRVYRDGNAPVTVSFLIGTRWSDPVINFDVTVRLSERGYRILWWIFPWDYCYRPGKTRRKRWFTADAPIEEDGEGWRTA